MNHARICPGMREHGGVDQIVKLKHIGLRDGFDRFEGQIVGVPWAGSNEGHGGKNSVRGESSHGRWQRGLKPLNED